MLTSIQNLPKLITKRLPPEKFFLLLAVIAGVIIPFRIQPLFGNDEIVHFPRAYHVQEGYAWTQHLSGYNYGGYLPSQIVAMNDHFREQVQNSSPDRAKIQELKQQYSHEKLYVNERKPLAFTSAGVYSPWAYGPAALGVGLARFLDLPLVWFVYLARISCFLIWALLVYWAIRLIPVGKYFLVTVALLPTSLVQASTIGMDGLVNGLAWVIVALTLAVFAKKVVLSPKLMAVIAMLSFYLATTKQGYALIAALPLIIPSSLYKLTRKQARAVRIAFGSLLVIISTWYISFTESIAGILHFIQRPGLHVDSGDQIKYFLTHPITVTLAILFAPLSLSYLNVYAGVVGVLTNRLIYLPIAIIVLLYIAWVAVIVSMKGDKQLHPYRYRLLAASAAAFVGTFILINLALYISFTKVGNPTIEGVQGRYLLPLAPLLIGMRAGWEKPIASKLSNPLIIVSVGLVLLFGVLMTIAVIR